MWLTDEELIKLTRKKQPAAQMRALDNAKPRPIKYIEIDGRPVVLASDLAQTAQKIEPQLRLIRAT